MLMMSERQEDVVYTIQEIAKLLKVSDQVVRDLVKNGELRSKRVGRQYRITREMLDEYLSSK